MRKYCVAGRSKISSPHFATASAYERGAGGYAPGRNGAERQNVREKRSRGQSGMPLTLPSLSTAETYTQAWPGATSFQTGVSGDCEDGASKTWVFPAASKTVKRYFTVPGPPFEKSNAGGYMNIRAYMFQNGLPSTPPGRTACA